MATSHGGRGRRGHGRTCPMRAPFVAVAVGAAGVPVVCVDSATRTPGLKLGGVDVDERDIGGARTDPLEHVGYTMTETQNHIHRGDRLARAAVCPGARPRSRRAISVRSGCELPRRGHRTGVCAQGENDGVAESSGARASAIVIDAQWKGVEGLVRSSVRSPHARVRRDVHAIPASHGQGLATATRGTAACGANEATPTIHVASIAPIREPVGVAPGDRGRPVCALIRQPAGQSARVARESRQYDVLAEHQLVSRVLASRDPGRRYQSDPR